jgi:hypothetical protein
MEKTKVLHIRLTDEEFRLIEEASIRVLGRPNKGRFIRKLIRDYIGMGPDLTTDELNVLSDAVRQLTGIARNLNQITSRINSDEKQLSTLSEHYMDTIKTSVDKVNNTLKDYVKNTIHRYQDKVNHHD